MFFKYIINLLILLIISLETVEASPIECKIETIELNSKEYQEIFKQNRSTDYQGTTKIIVRNFSIVNEDDINDFKYNLNKFVSTQSGELNIKSALFLKMVGLVNENNILSIIHFFGEDEYDHLTQFNFKDTEVKMRYKDVVNSIIMVRYGEDFWGGSFPYPFWNVPIDKSKNIKQKNYGKFSFSKLSASSVIMPIPLLKRGRDWLNYDGQYEYSLLLDGYYDRNIYYTWRFEWGKRAHLNNRGWNRDYAWLEKTINEYKGSDGELMVKLNNAKNNLQGFCN